MTVATRAQEQRRAAPCVGVWTGVPSKREAGGPRLRRPLEGFWGPAARGGELRARAGFDGLQPMVGDDRCAVEGGGALELLIDKMKATGGNEQFLREIAKVPVKE